ncbi:MAG: amidohydrolase [Bacteroidales bacterium]|nr:amidohydrolase [Bacteroidales bacterium]
MKVLLVQQDIVWGDPEANRKHLSGLLSGAPGADLYVLPEMFTTGFATRKEDAAEDNPDATLGWMKAFAEQRGAAIAGSIALRQGERRVNRLYFVKPDGSVAYYDKKHLFLYGGEQECFDAGNERVIVEWGGVRFLLNICYDLRFPVWMRNRGDYDAIITVANWPGVRRTAWDILNRARAIENQCYVLAVNRCGSDPLDVFNGGTALIHPYGEAIAAAPDGAEGFAEGELDMKFLGEYARRFPVTDSADSFILQ